LQVWGVLKESKALDSTPRTFGYEKNRPELVFKGVPQLLWKFGNFFLPQQGKLLEQDLLNLGNGIFVHRQGIIVDSTDSKHFFPRPAPVHAAISGSVS